MMFYKMASGSYQAFKITPEMAQIIRVHKVVSPLQWYYNPITQRCMFALREVDCPATALAWLSEDVLYPHETINHQFDLKFLERA